MAATYQAESFYRAKISSSIASAQSCPITIRVSKLPSRSSGLLTISPNTENEEIVEYGNINATNMTIDITKRGVNPASGLLTTAGSDYNNPTFQRDHAQNEIIRGDVNHIHINQGVANTILASNTTVGISKLSVAPYDANDPIAVGTNDPRIGQRATTTVFGGVRITATPTNLEPTVIEQNDGRVNGTTSTTQMGVVKLSVEPATAGNPIAVGDNDPRLSLKIQQGSGTFTPSNGVETITLGWRPKRIRLVAVNVTNTIWGRSDAHIYEDGGITKVNNQWSFSQVTPTPLPSFTIYNLNFINRMYINDSSQYAILLRWERDINEGSNQVGIISRGATITATGFTLDVPAYSGVTDKVMYYWEAIG